MLSVPKILYDDVHFILQHRALCAKLIKKYDNQLHFYITTNKGTSPNKLYEKLVKMKCLK